jgi:hypothetical protein
MALREKMEVPVPPRSVWPHRATAGDCRSGKEIDMEQDTVARPDVCRCCGAFVEPYASTRGDTGARYLYSCCEGWWNESTEDAS